MAFSFGNNKPGAPARPAAPRPAAPADITVSCRATNPLSVNDDLEKVFIDERQAKATTATRLFRNDQLFNALSKTVLPDYFAKNKTGQFCLWSTGCSSGEEVYSLAMIALGEFSRVNRAPHIEAFGTDINKQRILEGRRGVYLRPAKDSFNSNYWRLLAAYAQQTQTEIIMGEQLRAICKFTLFDMRQAPKKHTFHFIVCNHVMQYYDAPGQRLIIGNLKSALKKGGYMYLEGVTAQGLTGSNLVKLQGCSNLYQVEEK